MPDQVVILIVLGTYVLASIVAASLFTANARQRARGAVGRCLLSLGSRSRRAAAWAADAAGRPVQALQAGAGAAGQAMRRRPLAWGAGFALLLLPLAVVLAVSPLLRLEGFDDAPRATNPVVDALLRGEQLVPPPSMPPEAFTTPEIAEVRPDLVTASRDWAALEEDFRRRLLLVFQLMEVRGYPMVLLEGYRSRERQATLAALGPHVTHAGAYRSFHQHGLAADCAFRREGRVVISERDPWAMEGYRLYGEIAESVGLAWGGRWTLLDYGHVELRQADVPGRQR